MQFSAHLFCSCSVSMPASAAPSLQRLSLTLSFSAPCLMQFTVLTIFLENSFSCMQQGARTAAAATVTVAGNTVIKCQQQCQLMPCSCPMAALTSISTSVLCVSACMCVTDVAVTILRLDVMHSLTITARTTGTPTHN